MVVVGVLGIVRPSAMTKTSARTPRRCGVRFYAVRLLGVILILAGSVGAATVLAGGRQLCWVWLPLFVVVAAVGTLLSSRDGPKCRRT